MGSLGVNSTTPGGIVNIATSGEGSLLLNLFGKKCLVWQESLYDRVCKRFGNGLNTGFMRASSAATVLWELRFIASTARLLFLSSASKCQYSDNYLILPVDVCACNIAFSCHICQSLCIFLSLKNTRLCECVVAEHWYVISNRTECLYSIIIKFCA